MPTAKSVWGIDIGQVALKALKLSNSEGELQVEAFDIIEHPKILSQPDADRKQLIRQALEQFLARNNVAGSQVYIAVPGQASFTRFVKLPPVEEKRIPEIVKFEAEQQIPFPINEVIWRYQTFHDPDSPDVELGIFAMKKVDVADTLTNFTDVAMTVDGVQMAPLALYNFMTFDGQLAPEGATLLADIGADRTDLVISDGPRIWTRTIQIGGNNFTEALVRGFKLSFAKAEKLKCTAASSKFARQIFQAMRPVFADLVQEIHKSIGYYTSLHRECRFKRLIGLGNGFRLPGLQKFLEQNLNVPVVRIDSFNKIQPSSTVNAPAFTENVLSFAVAYGLALQGLGQTAITTNLLPGEVARSRSWARKKAWFAAAAASLLLGLGVGVYRGYADQGVLGSPEQLSALPSDPAMRARFKDLADAQAEVDRLEGLQEKVKKVREGAGDEEGIIKNYFKMLGFHSAWPAILSLTSENLVTSDPKKELFHDQFKLQGLAEAPDEAAFKKLYDQLAAKPRKDLEMFFVESLKAKYSAQTELPGSKAKGAGFTVEMVAWTPVPGDKVNRILLAAKQQCATVAQDVSNRFCGKKDAIQAELEFNFVAPTLSVAPVAATPVGTVAEEKDAVFGKDPTADVKITVTWKILVSGDGVTYPPQPTAAP